MSNELLNSFFAVEDEQPQIIPLDRSTLERYATCPALARFVESGRVVEQNNIMASGNEGHAALSNATAEHIRARGAMNAGELAEYALAELRGSRPDLQPDVIDSVRATVWSWSRLVGAIHHENILHFDGGEELKRPGQLAADLASLGVRPTSEVDLVYAGDAPKMLHEIDYKTGHKVYSVRDVAESFQFQMHAWLVLQTYPEVDCLEVRVWNTRRNLLTYGVEFKAPVVGHNRDGSPIRGGGFPAWDARIRHAAGLYVQHMHDTPEEAPAWPTVEKCDGCRAAIACRHARLDHGPAETLVDSLVAMDAKRAEISRLLDSELKRRGVSEIISELGNAYGYGKPKRATKAKPAVYQVGKQESEESDASEAG